jgi:hypothetical protein
MFDFGKSPINMNPDEQKKMLDNATSGQRKTALEMGIGFRNQNQQQRQQKRDAYHDLDRLNTIVEKENEAHDFFGKGLADWQKNVTGKKPSKDASNLKKQYDDYEHSVLSTVTKGGKRHEALSKSLPDIKKDFLQQGHQFALNKLNERSRTVLDKGLQRLAKGALGANDENGIQAHDAAAFDLINKYVMSEAKFDEKNADAMYDKYLSYTGVDIEKARASENKNIPGAKPGFKMKGTEIYTEKNTGVINDTGEKKNAELQIPEGQDEIYKGNQYRGKVKPKKTEPTTEDIQKLGKLSEKYETGGRGVSTVSSGKGDPGGVSYGLYQMTSVNPDTKKVGGTVEQYVNSNSFPWKKEFEGLKPGSNEFSAKWKEISEKHPEEFRKNQHAYIYETHYKPAAAKLENKLGVDMSQQSSTLKDVVWSTGVQHKPKLINKAFERFEKTSKRLDKSHPDYEKKLIEAIYDERATRCGDCSPNVKQGFRKRIVQERKEALELLKMERSQRKK